MSAQLPLFGTPVPGRAFREITVPSALAEVLARPDAALYVSISGGKDGQAMLSALARLHLERGWKCGLFAIHAHLGRAEWPESLPHCERICAEAGVPLTVVERPQGDLVQEISDRMAKLAGEDRSPWPTATQRYCTADQKRDQLAKAKRTPGWPDAKNRYCTADQKRTPIDTALRAPMWPDAANRYCTSHQKTNQIDKELRAYRLVVSAIGIRGGESRSRAKKNSFTIDADLTGKAWRDLSPEAALAAWEGSAKGRLAFDWLPIFDWNIDEVWEECGTSATDVELRRRTYAAGYREEALDGWTAHPAYVYGNERVSCVFCVLAGQNDLSVGARHNPDLFRLYVGMEEESGFDFQHRKPLAAVAPELLAPPEGA